MICNDSIKLTTVSLGKKFINWARALTFTAKKSFRPTTRGEIVEIIRQAEEAGQRVKWTGSVWSFMGNYVSNDIVIESDDITGLIPNSLFIDKLLPPAPARDNSDLAHVKGGTKVFNVNRLLHGLPTMKTKGDEDNLSCGSGRALPTLGGSGGQSIAGVMATGSHGGDMHLPPIADAVMAIHLIGPGGQEWWIERTSGLTPGSEAQTQAQLESIVKGDPLAAKEMCGGILVKKDDALFRAAVVSVGRMGFVYSLVIKTVPAFKLFEDREPDVWEDYRKNLTSGNFSGFTAGMHFLQVIIKPFADNNKHGCIVSARTDAKCGDLNTPPSPGNDILNSICQQMDVRRYIPILLAALATLLAAVAALWLLAGGLLAAANAALAVPIIGWAIAAGLFAAYAAVLVVIAALVVTITALTALIAYISLAGKMTARELIAAIADFMYTFGMKEVMKKFLLALFDSLYPAPKKTTNIGWKIMDTYNYDGESQCEKVDSMEFAFDVAAAPSVKAGYLAFIDEVLAIIDDLFNRNIVVAGILSLRYTTRTTALIGMSRFDTTCHIEIPFLRSFRGNPEFIERTQKAAIKHGGVPHWGQLMGTYTGADVRALHGADMITWRKKLAQLIRDGNGKKLSFSNDFTFTYTLEPLDDTAIKAVRFTVTVGDDSLGDTDLLRQNVSADLARVTLLDGTFFEVSLNEGKEWKQHTTHVRDVPVASGTTWGDVRSVRIEHKAAGNDWNADNWTMSKIVIESISTGNVLREELKDSKNPFVWEFKKNQDQIWKPADFN